MAKLNPDALAECGDPDLDARNGVQAVYPPMIERYVIEAEELPKESAEPFSEWIYSVWVNWNEAGELTNGDVISGALAHWRGQA